jgi:CRP-like cAMP-binding protein
VGLEASPKADAGAKAGAGGKAASGGKLASAAVSDAIKERLTKRRTTVRLASVIAGLSSCVPDTSVRGPLLERAQKIAYDDTERRGAPDRLAIDLDSFLTGLMAAWDVHEGAIEGRRVAKLEALVREMVGASEAEDEMSIFIGYDEFEQLVKEVRRRGGLDTNEEHLELLMDMFDDALRETEKLLGEESDVLCMPAFVQIAERYALLALLEPSSFVDPLGMSLEEREQKVLDEAATGAAALEAVGALLAAPPSGTGKARSKFATVSAKTRGVQGLAASAGSKGGSSHRADFQMIKASVLSNFLFRHLDDEMLSKLVERMREVRCEAGRIVCREGDKGDFFYVVESGVYAVYKAGELVHAYTVQEGLDSKPCFGELALMYAKPRAATVRCTQPGTLWALDRQGFREAQRTSKGFDVTKVLGKVQLLNVLRFDQLQLLRDRMVAQSFKQQEHVITEGDPGSAFYVILRGSAVVRKMAKRTNAETGLIEEVQTDVASLSEFDAFGEAALLNNAPRNASIVAASQSLECLALDRATFEEVLGPLQAILDKQAAARDAAAREVQEQQLQAGLSTARRADFVLQRQLGAVPSTGALLFLASHGGAHDGAIGSPKAEAMQYTLRVESLASVAKAGSHEEVLAEVALLRALPLQMSVRSAVLPQLLCTFRDERALHWVFSGRALCTLSQLNALDSWLEEACVLWVVACVTAALDALHSQRVLLRGVAAPALVVNDAGYVTVIDLRHSRTLQGEPSFSLVGLPQYLAPEQVRGEGHAYAVDWWSLGVLAHELAFGKMPFGHGVESNELAVAQAILEHTKDGLRFPETPKVSELTRELIASLLDPDPQQRLGGEGGAAAVRDLPVLGDINWAQLASGTLQSPIAALAAEFIRSSGLQAVSEPVFEPINSSAADWCSEFPFYS